MPECPTCERGFDTERGVMAHHAQVHGESIAKVPADCAYCGEGLTRYRYRIERSERQFCDPTCRAKWEGENRDTDHFVTRGERVEYECDYCGETSGMPRSQYEANDQNFCDRDCMREATYREAACDNCGETFRRKHWRFGIYDREFCSRDCFWEANRGEANARWKGGLFPYGLGWDEEKREQVRERDGRECRACGMGESEHLEKWGWKLEVHHITPARKIDDPEERNSMDNLVSLCFDCHKDWEGVPVAPQPAD